MQTIEAIEKDLHPPYQILIIFMLMLTISAYSQQKSNASTDAAQNERHGLLQSRAAPMMTQNHSATLPYKAQSMNENLYYSTVVSKSHATPTLNRGDTPQFAD